MSLGIKERLRQQGYESVFLDFDPQLGIPAGTDWEQELYRQLRTSRAVIAVVSKNWHESHWCFAEVSYAKALGKPVFPLRIDASELDPVLRTFQAIDFVPAQEVAYQRLWQGLSKAGLDPMISYTFRPGQSPYPGLDSFQETDAAVYFGREQEVGLTMELLSRVRRVGEPRLVVVVGSSGSGKSSLVRAGLVPRLKKDPERWVILPAFRPGPEPTRELSRVLAMMTAGADPSESCEQIHRQLCECPAKTAKGDRSSSVLLEVIRRTVLRNASTQASALLIVDQLEEVFFASAPEDASRFLTLLREAANEGARPLVVLATLRSAFLGEFQNRREVGGLSFEAFPLGPMRVEHFPQVIRGPAAVVGMECEDSLVDRMVRDTPSGEALPLLAFSLRLLYDRCRGRPILTTADYTQVLGSVEQALARTAENLTAGALTNSQVEAALRSAFVKLVRMDEQGRVVRAAAEWQDLPGDAHAILERLVNERLLVSREEGGRRVVEVAHEALFRVWGRLAGWLGQEREFLLARRRLQTARELWIADQQRRSLLLKARALAEARDWLRERPQDLSAEERFFVQLSVAAQTLRRSLSLTAATVLVVLLAALVRIYFQVPRMAWTSTGAHISAVERAQVVTSDKGTAGMRVLTLQEETAGEGIDYDTVTILDYSVVDLSEDGAVAGIADFWVIQGALMHAEGAASKVSASGSLEAISREVNERLVQQHGAEQEVYGSTRVGYPDASDEEIRPALLGTSNEPAEVTLVHEEARPGTVLASSSILRSSTISSPSWVSPLQEAVRARVEQSKPHESISEVWATRVYMTPAGALLAVGDCRLGRMGMVTVAARSEDGGKTWKQAETEVPFRANSMSGLAIAFAPEGGQTILFVSAVHDNFGYSNSRLRGGLFRSVDGGLTWTRLALGQQWDSWNSYSGVHVAVGNPEVLAVVLAPKAGTGDRRPWGVPGVLLSRDGGATWKLLDSGLSAGATTSIRILHLTKDGCVFAVAEPGEIAVWRKLTFWERFRASYGVSL